MELTRERTIIPADRLGPEEYASDETAAAD